MELALDLRMARTRLDDDPFQARALLDAAVGDIEEATRALRDLARGIHPAALTEGGLRLALEALVARSTVPTRIVAVPESRFAAAVEATAYFTVAEGLTNATRYAAAKRVEVYVTRRDGRLHIEVRDYGCGGADPARGTGLRGLADRFAALDGELDVISPPGGGTLLLAEIPCES